jgi:DNA polymerase family A
MIDIPHAQLRGRYMAAVAVEEWNGIPIDVELFIRIRDRREQIQLGLIAKVDPPFGFYEGTTFSYHKFAQWLIKHEIPWPRGATGKLSLERDTFEEMALVYPQFKPVYELRHWLSQLRDNKLAVGRDARNRCLLSPYATTSSRNAPSSSQLIFGASASFRSLIKPPPGCGLAYIDWHAQETGVAAALSGDCELIKAYQTGDAYCGFARAAGAVPADATAKTHPRERELYKACMLGVSYGMEERSLAFRIQQHLLVARSLLRHHHEIFWRYWEWSDNRVRRAMFTGVTSTVFGWEYHVTRDHNVRSIRNFPMQANGAEIMRLAVCLGVENGIKVLCSVHDAILIEAPLDRLDDDVARMRGFMQRASEIVLNGFKLRTAVTEVRYPDRYVDKRGKEFWNLLMSLL